MPPRRDYTNTNPSSNNAHTPGSSSENQFQDFIRRMMEQQQWTNEMMMDQQRRANETHARLQEQMAKKDEELAHVQRQLLEVLGRRSEPYNISIQVLKSSSTIVIRTRIFCLSAFAREVLRSS